MTIPNGINFRAAGTFDSDLPVIPYTLKGAPAARARFLATTGTTSGQGVTSWTSVDGAVAMTPVAGTAPTNAKQGGHTVVRFNGVDDQLQANLTQARPHSFAVAYYVHAVPPTGTHAVIVGGQITNSSDPAVGDSGMLAMGGPNWNVHGGIWGAAGVASTGWHTALVVFGPTTTSARIDFQTTIRDIGQVPRKIVTLGGHRGAYYADVSVAELVVWDGELTDDQVLTIEASMRDRYGI